VRPPVCIVRPSSRTSLVAFLLKPGGSLLGIGILKTLVDAELVQRAALVDLSC